MMDKSTANKYGLNLVWSEEDEAFLATSLEFPGLSAFGETIDEALAEGKIALELMIEEYTETGLPLPAPRQQPAYSGQFRVRLPKTLHRQAAELAEREGVSLNQFVVAAVAVQVGAETLAETICGRIVDVIREQSRVATNNVIVTFIQRQDDWPQTIELQGKIDRVAGTPSDARTKIDRKFITTH